MPKINIDGAEHEFDNGTTLIQACEQVGIEIPRFCYHERLSIAGNCRMCLIEVVGGPPKPQASCAMTVNDLRPGRNGEAPMIRTNSEMVLKARHGVMEFLLVNHPLDCPICDQGGECDLQDQAMAYGIDISRYGDNKRAVVDKYLGPLVKTEMTRCIHCTRCVRFTTEVAGVDELGATGRGEDMEITTYLEAALSSELQANVIDLCPVGALTARPTAFHARSWEYRKTETIDVMDGLGSAIRVDCRGKEVVRILPRVNDAINEEWISDKTRFVADGLKTQRLDRPYVRDGDTLRPSSWDEALALVATKLTGAGVGALIGGLAGVEEMFALRSLLARLGSDALDMEGRGGLDPRFGRASYLFNPSIAGIEDSDAIMLVGCNPRLEAPVLNARIRKRYLRGEVLIGVIGEPVDLTYPYNYLGAGPETLAGFAAHAPASKQRPMIIVGAGAYDRPDGAAVMATAAKAALALGVIKAGWNGFAVLHHAASMVGGLDLGLADRAARTADVIYNLGADETDIPVGPFVIYQGTHGDRGAHRADVVLPGAAYTEKSATYVNTEGRPQMTTRAAFPPGQAKEDWAIIRALSGTLGQTLPFDTLPALRAALYKDVPGMAALDRIEVADAGAIERLGDLAAATSREPFANVVADFYLTNPIARASNVMAEMSAFRGRAAKTGATGTHG